MRSAWLIAVAGGLIGLSGCEGDFLEDDPVEEQTGSASGGDTGGSTNGGATTSGATGAGEDSVDLGFRPDPGGFGFENYGDDVQVTNVTPTEVHRLFGDAACTYFEGGECVLTPGARQWMQQGNDATSGGHCEGMAVLSLLFFFDELSPADFGAERTIDLSLSNEALQREIAMWFMTQTIDQVATASPFMATADAVTTLEEAFEEQDELYTLGIYQADGAGGHAITPYRIDWLSDSEARIAVYDNNWPREERFIDVNVDAQTWRYSASTNPNEPASLYEGTPENGNQLQLTPITSRLGQHPCPFCAEDGARKPGDSLRQVLFQTDGALVMKDASGNRIGVLPDGSDVNELPGGRIIRPRSASLFADTPDPTYFVPHGVALSADLDGSAVGAATVSDVALFGPGYVLGALQIELEPLQNDTFEFSADGKSFVYGTSSYATPVVILGVETDTADYFFSVQAEGREPGQIIAIELLDQDGLFVVVIQGIEGNTSFDFSMLRIDETGEDEFSGEGIEAEAGIGVALDYANWQGNGTPVTIHVDTDNDGEVDETFTSDDVE
ncbi:MAG: hypothetical protein ACI9WU_000880 [Myxococcota bacterium]|jgi:hypothetical protein